MNRHAQTTAAVAVALVALAACRLPGQSPAPQPNQTDPGLAAASPSQPAAPSGSANPTSANPAPTTPAQTARPAPPAVPPVQTLPAGLPSGFPLLPGQVVIAMNRPTDATGLMLSISPARGSVDAGVVEAGRLLEAAGYARRSFTEAGPSSYARGDWLVEISRFDGFGQPLVGYRVWQRNATAGGSSPGGGGSISIVPGPGQNGGVAGP